METGAKPSLSSAIDLDTYFKLPWKPFQTMAEEIEEAGIQTAPPPDFRAYAELEKQANTILKFEALLMSGLFQTENYARTVLGSLHAPNLLDEPLSARMTRRAEVLDREPSPRVWLTIDEWVLKRTVGGPDVMREQLAALLKACDNP